MIKVTQKKSVIKSTRKQRETVRGLGLRRIRHSRVLQDTPEVRGMINRVQHLVDAEEVQE
ncbi:50S ribosomal protein L30 [Thermodesulfobacteriota bacterium]